MAEVGSSILLEGPKQPLSAVVGLANHHASLAQWDRVRPSKPSVTRSNRVGRTINSSTVTITGELAEWTKAPASKTDGPAMGPRVRIPYSPPLPHHFDSMLVVMSKKDPSLPKQEGRK